MQKNLKLPKIKMRWLICALIVISIALPLTLVLAVTHSAACTYVMTDGERYETVRLYPGSVEEACSKAGFRNVEVVNRKDDDGIVYLCRFRPAKRL